MENQLHLLLIDDDEDEFILLKEMIAHDPHRGVLKRLHLDWISDFEKGVAALLESNYDIYLVDYRLGGRSGLDLLRQGISPDFKAPVILLTGQDHYEIDMAAMQLGASDYLVKGEFTLPLLERSIRYALERKQHEEALHRSELTLRKAQKAAKMGSWTWLPQQDRLEASDELYQLFNIKKEKTDIAGSSVDLMVKKWIHPEDRDMVRQALLSTQMESQQFGVECRVIREDGTLSEIWIERVERIQDSSGVPTLVTGIIQDITDRKKIERALLQSEKMASLGTLSAGMAHEINTPLQVITGASENLKKKLDSGVEVGRDEVARQIAHISINAWRIASIVRSLLDYARASSEELVNHSLNEIVESTLSLVGQQFQNWSNITISTRLASDLTLVTCEPNRMIQVLVNLLNNARDAMPEGGPILIETAMDADKHQVILRVIDSGAGIPEPIQGRIFDPFFTNKPGGKGTGLGLYISQGIIQAAGGTLELEKSSNSGSIFKLTLPAASPEDG